MEEIIRTENLTKRYGDFCAVDHLSFSVNKGDIYGFLGQNGAGKSTTIRMLLSLIEPTEGHIELLGMDLKRKRREILSRIGSIVEKPDVYPYLSAYQNLKLFTRLGEGVHTSRFLNDLLDKVGLSDYAQRKVGHFSQGMKQRLGLAIALAKDPELVILDEPTNGLDPQGIADIRRFILDLSRVHGKTVFLSSHLLSEIEQIATRILIINKGKKVIEGTTESLTDTDQVAVSIQCDDLSTSVEKLRKSSWAEFLVPIYGGKLQLQLPKASIPALHRDLDSMGINLYSMEIRHRLEDYFLKVTSIS